MLLLKKQFADHIKDTPFGFKGYEGSDWHLEMEAPRAAMSPDASAVNTIINNASQKQVRYFHCFHFTLIFVMLTKMIYIQR